jgi:5-methylcytosine-specific restriction enzyme subunit McrC
VAARVKYTVFEHEKLLFKTDDAVERDILTSLEKYHEGNDLYFDLTYKGVKFKEYVGAIQVGNTVIEVLPKADRARCNDENERNKWRDVLIGMLKAVHSFEVKAPSETSLKIRPNSILDLYFEMFVKEVEYLFHTGLVKKYRKTEGNRTALKGRLNFAKNIQKNLTHQERFYVNFVTYDTEHILHKIIYKTVRLLMQINTSPQLKSRIGNLMLNLPEMPDIKVTADIFDKVIYDRKTQGYKNSIEIARLLLLQYHPDLSGGRNHVLALMFDMNLLWEKFVFISLRKYLTGHRVEDQVGRKFWQPEKGYAVRIKPDIIINQEMENCAVLDTKWKNIGNYNPSPEDLRQMYAYGRFFKNSDSKPSKVALVYPGESDQKPITGVFLENNTGNEESLCAVIRLKDDQNIKVWQQSIAERIQEWIGI